ncbi:MAG: M20/M25/M40 family metallo-hydrolase [Chloroflexi bacterium]|nr:M20/M25/M40 family metallo-hydrolase [Chloroflexota bacterium]
MNAANEHLIEQLDQATSWSWLADLTMWTLDQAMTIQQIPAPTFAELARAQYVSEQFAAFGLQDIATDDVYNVYGLLPGANRTRPGLMIAAHTDTVFDAQTELTLTREPDVIRGPGIGDNSLGAAALLTAIRALQTLNFTPPRDLWFVATSREEGLGDLGGMRAAFTRLQPHIDAVINLEGLAFGHVYHAGIAVRRLRISAQTEGGHSWLHFGRPSAIHGLMTLGAQIATLRPPASPRTTYNIGVIEGGRSINTIANSACLWLDLRSEDRETLAALEHEVRDCVEALTTPDLTFEIEVVGDRPAGRIDPAHPLVQQALAALAQVGATGALEVGSTDANIPLSAGCPAVTIGITRGGNAHRLDEYLETAPVKAGLRQLILLTLATAR